MMSEPLASPQETRLRRVLRISVQDVPALFSEGPEEELREAKVRRTAERIRAKMAWPALFEKLSERSKPASQS